jgi:hypothetical protein
MIPLGNRTQEEQLLGWKSFAIVVGNLWYIVVILDVLIFAHDEVEVFVVVNLCE